MTQPDVSAFSGALRDLPAPKAVAAPAGRIATIEQFIFGAAILGVAWVPFWLGSNREIAWLINAGYFGALVLLLEAVYLIGQRAHPVAFKRVAYPAAIFALTGLWIVVQASTWIPAWLENPIYQYGRDTFKIDILGSITINRELTYWALHSVAHARRGILAVPAIVPFTAAGTLDRSSGGAHWYGLCHLRRCCLL